MNRKQRKRKRKSEIFFEISSWILPILPRLLRTPPVATSLETALDLATSLLVSLSDRRSCPPATCGDAMHACRHTTTTLRFAECSPQLPQTIFDWSTKTATQTRCLLRFHKYSAEE